jgi:hypothetical protein
MIKQKPLVAIGPRQRTLANDYLPIVVKFVKSIDFTELQ